jgi:hypothetical protein
MAWQTSIGRGVLAAAVAALGIAAPTANGRAAEAVRARPAKRTVTAATDRRVELISVIFRLAGNPEYNRARVTSYAKAVDKHFAEHRTHEVVKFAQLLRGRYGVSYDAPMSLAVHMDRKTLGPATRFEPRPPALGGRWRVEDAKRFIELSQDFADQSSFDRFMLAQRPVHQLTAQRLQRIIDRHTDLDWFDRYFGASEPAEFRIIPSLVNGPNCYGNRFIDNDKRVYYCILGTWRTDRSGQPTFSKDVVGTIVHEFCHSYANPVIDRHRDGFEAPGKVIYEHVEKTMRQRTAYGNWQTMMYEYLVRAATIRYLAEHAGPLAAAGQATADQRLGFIYISDLCAVLAEYEKDRARYPTMDHLVPRIKALFDAKAAQLTKANESD